MTVNELLSGALVLYMQGGKGQELSYISRSESSGMGWYFWLKSSPGVYEIELMEDGKEGLPERDTADFYVRYYPAPEEAVLESYSVAEQILRFDMKIFDDGMITVNEEEHEICPCCAAGQMEEVIHGQQEGGHCACGHHDKASYPPRIKGIPRILKKFSLDKKLFVIGALTIKIEAHSFRAVLKTKVRLVRLAPEGITLQQNGNPVEIVEKNGIDRNVPGYELGKRFMKFFGGQFIAKMSDPAKGQAGGTEGGEGLARKTSRSTVEDQDVVIQYIWQRRQNNE